MILGIDPGAHGAWAVLSDDGALIHAEHFPTVAVKIGKATKTRMAVAAFAGALREFPVTHAWVELVASSGQMGVSSAFAFGQAAGIIEGVLGALSIPSEYVSPAVWKARMKVTADKGTSRQMAMRLWPASASRFARVLDADRAEAALIALYGIRRATQIA